jgi:prolyl oligopeptidase
MVSKAAKLRVARPTDNLQDITKMYVTGLGFKVLGEFQDHNGFDGAIIGHEMHNYHFEFTHHKGTAVGKAPTQDNLLVFYFTEPDLWDKCCNRMIDAGFKLVPAYNDYWDVAGNTFEDIDGYRVVLQNREWLA